MIIVTGPTYPFGFSLVARYSLFASITRMENQACHPTIELPSSYYLSACSTGTNKSATLIDESIHLISAYQLAGFRNVVGTLWEVDDEYCVDAAREVYSSLGELRWTDEAVALGTHRAARFLRHQTRYRREWAALGYVPSGRAIRLEGGPFIWAAYVHFGR